MTVQVQAFSTKSTYKGAGAYNADGTLKAGAKVIYVTPATAKTVKATVGGVEHTGLQDIVYGLQKVQKLLLLIFVL